MQSFFCRFFVGIVWDSVKVQLVVRRHTRSACHISNLDSLAHSALATPAKACSNPSTPWIATKTQRLINRARKLLQLHSRGVAPGQDSRDPLMLLQLGCCSQGISPEELPLTLDSSRLDVGRGCMHPWSSSLPARALEDDFPLFPAEISRPGHKSRNCILVLVAGGTGNPKTKGGNFYGWVWRHTLCFWWWLKVSNFHLLLLLLDDGSGYHGYHGFPWVSQGVEVGVVAFPNWATHFRLRNCSCMTWQVSCATEPWLAKDLADIVSSIWGKALTRGWKFQVGTKRKNFFTCKEKKTKLELVLCFIYQK